MTEDEFKSVAEYGYEIGLVRGVGIGAAVASVIAMVIVWLLG